MRRRIIHSLLALLSVVAAGFLVAIGQSQEAATSLGDLIRLHHVEDLRRTLIVGVQSARATALTASTPLGPATDRLVDQILELEDRARGCTSCHHEPAAAQRIEHGLLELRRFEQSLSALATASGSPVRVAELQRETTSLGEALLHQTEAMSLAASHKLEVRTTAVLRGIERSRRTLLATMALVLALGGILVIRLTRSVTLPVGRLVAATRQLSAGHLGVTVDVKGRDELAELAAGFNALSGSLQASYGALESEIVERRAVEEALRRSEERYALAARAANDGLWDWNFRRDRIFLSPRWMALVGHGEDTLTDAPGEWLGRMHPEDLPSFAAQLEALRAGRCELLESEHRILHADGGYRWMLCRGAAVRDEQGVVYRAVGSLADITARREAERQLRHDALHDALTGLPNRTLFLDRLVVVMHRHERDRERAYAVLFVDLDRFKVVNDSLGHLVGDRVLKEVGERILAGVRPADTVARLGGDEFGVLVAETQDPIDALQIAERIHEALRHSFVVEGHEVLLEASIGAALGTAEYDDPEIVLRDADIAMYQAKAHGRNSTEIFDLEMHGSLVDRHRLETDLRAAIDHGDEFLLHFQPVVDLATARPLGFEALVRWLKPDRGLLPAGEFIELAETSGTIVPLGAWILRKACTYFRTWQSRQPLFGGLTLSVNVSARQFREAGLVESVEAVLRDTGLPARSLCLELTESAVMVDWKTSSEKLEQLFRLGVGVNLDDFGTGYSSLEYLRRLRFTAIKIDRSFIDELTGKSPTEPIVRAILSIGESLGLQTIAEGVETPAQLGRLRELGCRIGQGFLFSRPLRAGDVENWVRCQMAPSPSADPAPSHGTEDPPPLAPCFRV